MRNYSPLSHFPLWLKSILAFARRTPRQIAWHIGHRGEIAAAKYLASAGYEILCMNWRAPRNLGELDIVCRDDAGTLCIVEVKTRRMKATNQPLPAPILAVTPEKQRRLRRALRAYLRAIGSPELALRYDVVEIWSTQAGKPVMLRHWPDLFAGIPRFLKEA